jgi:hypothetical protein
VTPSRDTLVSLEQEFEIARHIQRYLTTAAL